MPAGSTYSTIATTTLGSAASSITFSSISGSYTDLVLVIGNLQMASTGQGLRVNFNSDSGSNYSYTALYGTGSSAGSFRVSTTGLQIGWAAVGSGTAKSNVIASVQNYSNSTTYKTVLSRFNDSSAETGAIVGLWRNTAAITNIYIYSATNLNAGTMATLYGIASA